MRNVRYANVGKFHFTSSKARYFTMCISHYFTFCKSKTFHYIYLCPQMQCLSRKKDREFFKFSVLFLFCRSCILKSIKTVLKSDALWNAFFIYQKITVR